MAKKSKYLVGAGMSLLDLREAYAGALDRIEDLEAHVRRLLDDVPNAPTSDASCTERDSQVPPETSGTT